MRLTGYTGRYNPLFGIMKVLAQIAISLLALLSSYASDGNFLNVAILTLPAQYMADIPLEQRALLLKSLSHQASDRRLDYPNGFLNYYSDGDDVSATSMLLLKLLRRVDQSPLVFVHMPKPFATGDKPAKNQTFILENDGNTWVDVTSKYLPKKIDLKWCFQPRRTSETVEAGPYERYKRSDNRGYGYSGKRPEFELIWKNDSFAVRDSTSSAYHEDL